ncbi:MAG: DUF2304 domain-containing protein [Devosia nanyangense]|uniref:DUF2304 domain-containing protein n=1 Tax=Devosia nanyangense TaxID=1228055 RepID=A0A933L0D4_9HYPH|nr:DUF2304 domain-containing protein [Devosia nanyangense]
MIFQAILVVALSVLVLYALGQRRRSGPISLVIILASVAGMLLVLFPEMSTIVANRLGIGRGADLVFYVFMLIMFAAVANLHVRMRIHSEATTALARQIALSSARQPDTRS